MTLSTPTLIPAAGKSFTMGDNNIVGTNKNQIPAHKVKFTRSFYLDKYAVSWSLWKLVYDWAIAHGYTFEALYVSGGDGMTLAAMKTNAKSNPDFPAYGLGWIDCIKWCNARSEMEGLRPVYYGDVGVVLRSGVPITVTLSLQQVNGYRLPTEAEWEYAARGGIQSYYPYPGNAPDGQYATYAGSTWDKVSDNLPGNFGLLNMAGNVMEWTYDNAYEYTAATQTDPWQAAGAQMNPHDHISRGGNFMSEAWRTACCARKPYSDNWARTKVVNKLQHGFRCARTTI